ncbi:MAG: protein MpaA [Bradyrhizobium sp.]
MLQVACQRLTASTLLMCWATLSLAAPTPAAWCKRLSARLPEVSTAACQASNLQPSGGVSTNGFPILFRQISAANQGVHKPLRVMLLGGIHGDELTASAIVFKWLLQIQMPLAHEFAWDVVPVLNPDGLLAVQPSRVNARGVDLNRNFPTPGWQQEAPLYWSRTTASDPRRFPGKAPLSEVETRWLKTEIDRFKPNVIVSVHAPFGVLDFDGPAPVPERFGRLQFNRVGVYPGSLGNYSGLHRNIPVITIELPNARAMPPSKEVERIWIDMLTWINLNVRRAAEVSQAPKPAARVATPAGTTLRGN